MVMADGFAWKGQTYDSLSKVAFAITGPNGTVRASLASGIKKIPVMKAPSVKPVRCAIYTRVSTGLDQEFNSLDGNTMPPRPISRAKPMPAGP